MARTTMRRLLIIVLGLALLSSTGWAGALQGKLEKFGLLGISPADFIPVTLHDSVGGKTLQAASSGSDGIYVFDNCQPGTYILKVWPLGPDEKSLDFRITIPDQPVSNIAPILVHAVKIDYPKAGEILKTGMVKAKGTYYNMPEGVFLWVVLKDASGNYYVPHQPANIGPGGSWTCDVQVKSGSQEILLVLLTGKARHALMLLAANRYFPHLPPGAQVVSQYPLQVR